MGSKMKIALKRAAVAGGLLASLGLPLSSDAQSATIKTGYYTIDAMAMGPSGVSSDTNYAITDAVRNAANDPACFNTAVNLPHGAVITAVTVWYAAGPGNVTFVGLRRHYLSDGTVRYLAERELRPTNDSRKALALFLRKEEAAVDPLKINNVRFSYGFAVCLNGQNKTAFHNARITYTYLD
jgi:hypothetical protein